MVNIGLVNLDIGEPSVVVFLFFPRHTFHLVGPPGFEPGSDDPQPPSIGQANPRALLCLIAGLLTERSDLMNKV